MAGAGTRGARGCPDVDEEPCARPCKLVCLTGGGRSLLDEAHLMLHEGIPIRDGKIVT